ncbi:unnamed protein product [Brassicogethes aeneus]|uniref:Peptidase S1 domain-containing protein n=1 Tax=Brassicogethes aeneus TaxID=1431903 RepID=A0A9P0B8N8_BRAAE|nr:unnamed protein product [Brassicogethes aeneus]
MHFCLFFRLAVILSSFKLISCLIEENIPYNENLPRKPLKVITTEKCGIRGGAYQNRIVGGMDAEKNEFPWQISLQYYKHNDLHHFCGGAILNEEWFVTAAHCFENMPLDLVTVLAGAHNFWKAKDNEQHRNISRIVSNNFDLPTFYNDITLVKVYPPFDFSLATVTGWGRVFESGHLASILQKVDLPIINRDSCEKKYSILGFSRYFNECQMCTEYPEGTKDACQGDSGGPLICKGSGDKFYLCGIVSWGIGCARNNHPGVYTLVSGF